MQDVAVAAGVSWITVQRALRHPGSVTGDTQARIDAAIRDIGYLPHRSARGLVSRNSEFVAVLVPSIANPIYAEMVQGVADSLHDHGTELMLANTRFSLAEEERLVTALLARRPEAVILTGATHTPATVTRLAGAGIPVVETWTLRDRPIGSLVGFDNMAAQAQLTRELINRGYRRFAFVTSPFELDRWDDRRRGFQLALEEADLSVPDDLVFRLPPTLDSGDVVLEALKGRADAVDCVVCTGDVYAVGIVLRCRKAGIEVPRDLAVCGFGDFEVGRLLTPSLTTVHVRSYEIGATAGRLVGRQANENAGSPQILDTGFELVLRDST